MGATSPKWIVPTAAERERIFRRALRASSGCLLWQGATTAKGYGVITIKREERKLTALVHRLIFAAAAPTHADGAFVCHQCDTPACIEITHLFAGDARVNMADCVAKRRHARGERIGSNKLTAHQVQEIRQLRVRNVPVRDIAAQFGVDWSHAYRILRNEAWSHLP